MNKKTNTGKETRHMIKDKATKEMTAIKKETGEVIDKVKEAASEASRKGKAAIRAIKS